MPKTIYLITSNPGKVASFATILKNKKLPIQIEMLNADYAENKEDETTEGVVLDGARVCAQRYNKPVLVQDTGLFIHALNGFPGVNTKFALHRIGNEGFVKLLEGFEDRSCTWVFSLGYCEPGAEPISFTGMVPGTIAQEPRGKDGFGFDPIFIPDDHHKTFAEDIELRDRLSPFNQTVDELCLYLQSTETI